MESARLTVKREEGRKEDNCNAIPFRELCTLYESLSKEKGLAAKIQRIFSKKLKEHINGQSIYPLLRLLLPANDTERGKYGMKQVLIAKTYVAALSLNKDSDDAKRLLNWKDPTKNQGVALDKLSTGDFGLILEDVLSKRVDTNASTKTVGEVNALLDRLAGAVSMDEKSTILRSEILGNFNHIEDRKSVV